VRVDAVQWRVRPSVAYGDDDDDDSGAWRVITSRDLHDVMSGITSPQVQTSWAVFSLAGGRH